MKDTLLSLVIVALSAAACADDKSAQPGDTSGDDDTDSPSQVTFWDDVAPIFDASCMACHTDGGIAPFALDTYEQASTWAAATAAATTARTMPPWLVVGDGTCGEWAHNEWLSDEQVQTIADWVEGGLAEGTPGERQPHTGPTLEANHADQTPEFYPERYGGDYAEFDEYRCFKVDPGLTSRKFLTGHEVLPGNAAIVHHVIGNIVDPESTSAVTGLTNGEVMDQLELEYGGRGGWPCWAGAGDDVRVYADPIAWAPGTGAVVFPEGTGVTMEAGNVIVYQVHYNLADDADLGSSDSTTIELQLSDAVDRELYPLYIDYLLGFGDTLPSGESAYEYKQSVSFRDMGVRVPIDIWAITPHMHELGTSMTTRLLRDDGTNQCAADVPHWDFDWQRGYVYETPLRIEPDDEWEISCIYDTTSRTGTVFGGWGTQNEMCLTVLYGTTVD